MLAFTGWRAAACAALASIVALTAAGCGGGSGSGTGQLTVLLADAPPDLGGEVTEVNVMISRVEVHRSDAGDSEGWVTLFPKAGEVPMTYNLLDLANVQNVTSLPHLAEGSLPAGHYNQLRFIVASASIVVNGTEFPLVIPSGANTGLKALPFTVSANQDVVLLFDLDLAQSVSLQGDGTYKLEPVVRLVSVTLTSTLKGMVVNAEGAPMGAKVVVKNAGGEVVTTALTSVSTPAAETDGTFAVHGLASGIYTVEVSAEGYSTATKSVTVAVPTTADAGTFTLTAFASTGA